MVRSSLIVLALMLLGSGALWGVQRMANAVLDKDPAPLRKLLPSVPTVIGPYQREGSDQTMNAETVAVLGTEDYLLRNYVDKRKREGEVGYRLALNVNYYSKGSATPHVPDVCWAGSGKKRYGTGEDFLKVAGVPHEDGSVSEMRLRVLSFVDVPRGPAEVPVVGEGDAARLLNVAYVFHVNGGRYVATREEVSEHYWDVSAKYAYHAKIEVTVLAACSPAEAKEVVREFFRAVVPEIEKCLPDPALSASAGKGAATQAAKR